jgi:hypothetical protein
MESNTFKTWTAIVVMATCLALTTDLFADEKLVAVPEKCSALVSERATVQQIATNPTSFQGHCVMVEGVMQGNTVYDNVDGVYLRPKNILDPSSNGARLGLDNMGDRWSGEFRHASIIGRVQDCETVRECVQAATGPNEIVMISGYCHSSNGAYLWIHNVRFRKDLPWERRMGAYGRPGYGDLQPAPADWPHRNRVESLANEFLEAVRSTDRDKLADIHFRNVGLNWEDDEAALIRFVLRDRKSPFVDFRHNDRRPQQQILIERPLLDSDGAALVDDADRDNYAATVCFCRESDCTGRWPIAQLDADNVRTRPYVCTQIGPYYEKGETVPHFTTRIGRGGLAEPKRK